MNEQQKPAAQAPKQPGRPEPVRVRQLTFVIAMNIPGSSMPRQLTGAVEDVTNRSRYVITYEPWARHHRIEWFEANKDKPSRTLNVHESRVESWEAA